MDAKKNREGKGRKCQIENQRSFHNQHEHKFSVQMGTAGRPGGSARTSALIIYQHNINLSEKRKSVRAGEAEKKPNQGILQEECRSNPNQQSSRKAN